MANNIIKKDPIKLVDYTLLKHVAKINDIDIKTGNSLDVKDNINLLYNDIKICLLSIIRTQWYLILFILIISYYLYKRYNTVKELKSQQKKKKPKLTTNQSINQELLYPELFVNKDTHIQNKKELKKETSTDRTCQVPVEIPIENQQVFAMNEISQSYAAF